MRPDRHPTLLLLPLLGMLPTLVAQRPVQWVMPNRAVLAPAGVQPVQVAAAKAKIRILDRTATTTLEFELVNLAPVAQEAVLLVPLPDDAAVSAFAFEGAAAEPTAKLLARDEARRLYDDITRKLKDPALLEFVDWRCLRSSVFPVPAHGRQKIRLGYDHVLDGDGARTDYVLPRSEMLGVDAPWDIDVELRTSSPLSTCYSPSHELLAQRQGQHRAHLRVAPASCRTPGAFRLSFLTTADPSAPTASLFAYPDPATGGGWFLLLAGAPQKQPGTALRREVTLVLDHSGSMAGRKLEQAKAAALQVLEGLADGEGIQLIAFGNAVETAFPAPVAKGKDTLQAARAFLGGVRAMGGTNIHDALLEALRPQAMAGALPLVLFLTDGLPTVGRTREAELRQLIDEGNPQHRRVFCFGVGHDVNVPLLDRIAMDTRAITTYVQPEEDVELAVARTFARLDHPVLAGPALQVAGARVADLLPAQLPDLFAGDQLVVLGHYRGEDDLQFQLRGAATDGEHVFRFTLPVRSATTRNAFVPRLWASRQIAFLVDQLRQQGGDLGELPRAAVFADPKLCELRDEILRLSTQFGVLGEYTAFLATEGTDLRDWNALTAACQSNLEHRAVAVRSGIGAYNQGCNIWAQTTQTVANPRNAWLDSNLQRVETAGVQQVCDRAFFRRGERWIDGNSIVAQHLGVDERVEFGSARYTALRRELEAAGRVGVLALRGEVLLEVAGKNILVTPVGGTDSKSNPNEESNR